MAEWLLEIFSEEIPSRLQREAQKQLKSLAQALLQEENLTYDKIETFVTPRRLTLVVEGLPLHTPEKTEEKRGPRADAPAAAIEGFLKSANVKREDCEIKETAKGPFLFVTKKEPSCLTLNVLASIAPSLLERFRWPKSMRWGSLSTHWIRPIRGLLSVFEGELVPFSYAGVSSSSFTQGHRFLASKPFSVEGFKDYEAKLRNHFVILDWEERRTLIQENIKNIAKDTQLKPLEDDSLVDEVAGLVEWPIALKGTIDPQFMDLPSEVIITPMQVHQRYFPFVDSKGKLAPCFGVIANIETRDLGKTIVQGNERVLRARLADAQFFLEQDQKKPLANFNIDLKTRLFHQHLGSLLDKVQRLINLSSYIATQVQTNPQTVERAALLCKADLASHMVGEFPELQGIMGRYYAQYQGEEPEVARAIEEHYWPKGSSEVLPKTDTGFSLALADRIDTLVGFFAIGIAPSGSKDPFALRQTAIGLISLLFGKESSFPIINVLEKAYDTYAWSELSPPNLKSKRETIDTLWQFLLDRFKFLLWKAYGSPYDYVDAVLSIADKDPDFFKLSARIFALVSFIHEQDGKNLLAAYKRASNILRIEEEKDKRSYKGKVLKNLFEMKEEEELFNMLEKIESIIQKHINQGKVKQGDFIEAGKKLAKLRKPVDDFFNSVIVNHEDAKIRENRLNLLARLRQTMRYFADFSKIESS